MQLTELRLQTESFWHPPFAAQLCPQFAWRLRFPLREEVAAVCERERESSKQQLSLGSQMIELDVII